MSTEYTIMYVDDEPDNLLAFKSIYRRRYKVLLAESATQALDQLNANQVHLVISDQRMPGMYGTDFLEIVRDKYPDIIRILLTGYTDLQAVIDAINKGKIYHYVSKPWQVEELDLIIRQALELYELRTTNQSLTSERDQLLLRTAQQESEQIKAKFEILRNQINPHFLFNSLNVLISLIHPAPDKAVLFGGYFAKVYRRLLEVKDDPLIRLEEELIFTRDYLHLQEMRFDDALLIKENIAEAALDRSIPPFALQLLIENALKHNIVSEEAPLELELIANHEQLSIRNTLNPRTTPADSTKIGLRNLEERYRLLTDKRPSFQKTDTHYIAQLPLL
ncbi:MAG: histidine kinase [Bacteroidota bacterium]